MQRFQCSTPSHHGVTAGVTAGIHVSTNVSSSPTPPTERPNPIADAKSTGSDITFGLTPLRIDKGRAVALLDALQTARKAAKGHKETLRFPGRGDREAPLCFHGWGTYDNVAAKHDARQQSKHTCVLYRG